MVKAGESWVFQYPPAWKPPNQNGTGTFHEPKKQGLMTSNVNSGSPFSPSLAKFPWLTDSGIPGSNFHQINATTGSICYLPSQFDAFPPALNPHEMKKASLVSHEPDGSNPTLGSSGKRFLVFNQSEKGTRLIYGSSSPLFQKLELLKKQPCENFHVDKAEHPTNLSQFDLDIPVFLEESGENNIDVEETAAHEDTEEINAILYSGDDDNHDEEEDEVEDDEVTSTGHTPRILVQSCGKRGHVESKLDEVGNFSHLNKRQKPTGSECCCFNSLPMGTPLKKFNNSNEHESDANSSFAMSQAKEEAKFPALDGGLSKKDKICQMMKLLEGIVPGTEGKDPVVILDKAIEYLKTMKLKAKVLGMRFH